MGLGLIVTSILPGYRALLTKADPVPKITASLPQGKAGYGSKHLEGKCMTGGTLIAVFVGLVVVAISVALFTWAGKD